MKTRAFSDIPRPLQLALLLAGLALLGSLVLLTGRAGASAARDGCQAKTSRNETARRSDRPRRENRCGRRHSRKQGRRSSSQPAAPLVQPSTVAGPAASPDSATPDEPWRSHDPPSAPKPDPASQPVEPVPPSPAAAPPSSGPLYWGAWIKGSAGEAPWSMTAATNFEQLLGKKLSLINWSSPFNLGACNGYCSFQTPQFQAVRDHGSIPFFSWNPGPGGGAYSDAQIAAGSQDAYIKAWAQAAKKWGHPFFLRFAWEMNGSWFPWGVGNNGTTAADYVAMWRHVHDVFASVGATNATWVWCPNIDPYGKRAPLASVYPGSAYVDWTCLDGYNGANPWTSFKGLFKSTYDQIVNTVAPGKPMVVGETASTESGGSKADWIGWMMKILPIEFPQIRGLLWFDKQEPGPGGRSDWPLESSAAASSAFASGLQSGSFSGNSFGGISASPIQAP
jgi:hypothetical protein